MYLLAFKILNLSPFLTKIQNATPFSPLAFVVMASPVEDGLATKLKSNEGSPHIASPLAISFHNIDMEIHFQYKFLGGPVPIEAQF